MGAFARLEAALALVGHSPMLMWALTGIRGGIVGAKGERSSGHRLAPGGDVYRRGSCSEFLTTQDAFHQEF